MLDSSRLGNPVQAPEREGKRIQPNVRIISSCGDAKKEVGLIPISGSKLGLFLQRKPMMAVTRGNLNVV